MKISSRAATSADAPQLADWITKTDNNLDPDIANYPSIATLAIERDGEPVAYVPYHPVIMVESLARKPGASNREIGAALLKFQEVIEGIARHYGIAEVWWETSNPAFVAVAERHGYTAVKTTVLKKKVGR